LRAELNRVEEAQERLLMETAVQPRPSVKMEIFSAIEQGKPAGKLVEMNSGNVSFWRFAAAASIAVALVSSILAYNYWSKWKETSKDLTALITQNQRIAEDYNQVNHRLDDLAKDIRVMEDPQFKKVVMKGTENAPEALASVYWNESSHEVYLRIQNMKTLATENQYQLWAIIDGKPVDAGVFDGGVAGLMKMKDIGKGASTFAVTIEPKGGKQSPTIQTMQVAGNVEKS
jgi:anti-sigma-K factor RskA